MFRNSAVALFGRDADISAVSERLEGSGVLLVGARRIGKTELIKHIRDNPPRQLRAVRVDLEGLTDVSGAVDRVRDAFERDDMAPRKLLDRLKELRRIEVAGVLEVERRDSASNSVAPWEALEELIEAGVQKLGDKRLALFLDEVPWWLDSMRRRRPEDDDEDDGDARVRQALAQLRYLRQREGLTDRVRFVLTGSVGLAGLASAAGAAAELNDLATYELRPLAEADGMGLFESELAARGIGCTVAAAKEAYRLAGGSPHWIKQLAAKIPSGDADPAVVEEAVEQLLSPRMRHMFEDEGHAHIQRRHGTRAPALRAMLSAAAASDSGATRAAVMTAGLRAGLDGRAEGERAVMQLVDEFYLEEDGDRLRFSNPMFRRWWERFGQWR
jgi:uncharacterized protein